MPHPLDNPTWNALISHNSHLGDGNERARYFHSDVSPFVALPDNSADGFHALYEMITHQQPLLLETPEEISIPENWKTLNCITGIQMVCNNPNDIAFTGPEPAPLNDTHIPEMIALTKLTDPGPFRTHTIDFGHYRGIFSGDQLVAMAGQRLHAFDYAEISAVCTHPDHLGKGYAKTLLSYQINRIAKAGAIPFLHVRADNHRAIGVYESLGFSTRGTVYFYVFLKK